jgi:hypothetical protein
MKLSQKVTVVLANVYAKCKKYTIIDKAVCILKTSKFFLLAGTQKFISP